MSDTMNNENTEMKYLGVEATERLIENLSANMQNSLLDKLSYNEQTLTPEQQEQVRKNIGVVQPDYAQNDPTAPDYIKNRLAYTEPRVLTYDGALDKRGESNSNGIYSVRVSDELIDLNSVKKVELTPANGDPMTFEVNSENSYIEIKDGYPCMFGILNGLTAPVIYVITSDVDFGDLGYIKAGTYFYGYENQNMVGYISCVEYGEEIVHKLDPKYLPEGGFGYIESGLQTIKWDGSTDGKTVVSLGGLFSVVNVTKEPINPESIKRVLYIHKSNGSVAMEILFDEITVVEKSSGAYFVYITSDNLEGSYPMLVICDSVYSTEDKTFPKGVNLLTNTYQYIGLVEYDDEVVHKIDPKYYDRLAWEEVETVWEITDTMDAWVIEEGEATFELDDGVEYIVEIDNHSYKTKAYSITQEGVTGIVIGDASFGGVEGVESTGERFVVAVIPYAGMFMAMFGDPEDENAILSGTHTIRISKNGIHKIDPKYLPKMDTAAPDWAENNEFVDGYIKNRPCYDGWLSVDPSEAVAAGNPKISNSYCSLVRICDFTDNTTLLMNGRYALGGTEYPFKWGCNVLYNQHVDEDWYCDWEICDIDMMHIIGISEKNAKDAPEAYLSKYGISEIIPGIYAFCGTHDGFEFKPGMYRIDIPVLKKLNKQMVDLSYSDLRDLPFGDIGSKTISFIDRFVLGEINVAHVPTEDNDDAILYRVHSGVHFTYESIVGNKILLSNGSEIVITDSNMKILKSDNEIMGNRCLIAERLLINGFDTSECPESVEIVPVDYSITSWEGIYVNFDCADGVYATGMTISKPYTKQLDTKYIPTATSESLGIVKAQQKTEADIQPVKVDENGGLFVEPIAYDGENILKLSREDTVSAPFTKDDLIGLKVVDRNENRWRLKTPSKRLTRLDNEGVNGDIFYGGSDWKIVVSYTNVEGALNNRCLIIWGSPGENDLQMYCPSLYGTQYNTLLYVYETTSDNLGLGITFEEGWYACNRTTFSHMPIDIERHNCALHSTIIADGQMTEEEYFMECFTNDDISYTISEDNIYTVTSKEDTLFVNYLDIPSVSDSAIQAIQNLYIESYSSFRYNIEMNMLSILHSANGGATSNCQAEEVFITYPYFKQIDPKFIPAALITDSEADALIASII